jgi:hypothetical protein
MLRKKSMILMCAVMAGTALAADAPREIVYHGVDLRGGAGSLYPTFDGGYLFQMDSAGGAPPTLLAVFGPDGEMEYRVSVRASDGSIAYMKRAAADTDGTVIVSVWYGGYGGSAPIKGGGIAFFDKSGAQTRFLDTGQFIPNGLCFGPDHSVWTVGAQFRSRDEENHSDYALVRKYSVDGEQVGSYLSRSSFPEGLPPGDAGIWTWIKAANDRIGVMTTPGEDSRNPVFIELDLQGKEIGRWKVKPPERTVNWAYTADGRLFASRYVPGEPKNLFTFDKTSESWRATASSAGNAVLLGADGNNLVYHDGRGADHENWRLRWIPTPQ